jgi:hypothetical protein
MEASHNLLGKVFERDKRFFSASIRVPEGFDDREDVEKLADISVADELEAWSSGM